MRQTTGARLLAFTQPDIVAVQLCPEAAAEGTSQASYIVFSILVSYSQKRLRIMPQLPVLQLQIRIQDVMLQNALDTLVKVSVQTCGLGTRSVRRGCCQCTYT